MEGSLPVQDWGATNRLPPYFVPALPTSVVQARHGLEAAASARLGQVWDNGAQKLM